MVVWPTFLPGVQLAYTATVDQPAVSRVQMTTGRTRQRMKFTQDILLVSVQWTVNDVLQFAAFQSFFKTSINNGADFFTIDLPLGSGLDAGVGATGLLNYTARFKGVYKAKYNEGKWVISAMLEITATQTMSAATYAALLAAVQTGSIADGSGGSLSDGSGGGISI